MRKIKNCPLCGIKMEITNYRDCFHPDNDCILHGFGFDIDARRSVESWNTRKPIEIIVERLEQESGFYGYYGSEDGRYVKLNDAIQIVEEEM